MTPSFLHLCKVYIVEIQPTAIAKKGSGMASKRFEAQKKLKDQMVKLIKLQKEDDPALTGPLELNIQFFMPIPLTTTKTYSREIANHPHTLKPDINDLLTLLIECCYKADLWQDQAQLARLVVNKIYAQDNISARTEFYLKKL